MNLLDKKPIYMGGRNNGWRELSTLCNDNNDNNNILYNNLYNNL